MHLADAAWKEVDTTTIQHCWAKAGILPLTAAGTAMEAVNPSIPVSSMA